MKNLNFWLAATMAVVIVGVGTIAYNQGASDQEAAIASGRVKVKIVASPLASPASADTAAYNQLLQQYRNARIQFVQSCQATPTSSSFRNGASIMLDNHSNKAHTVTIASKVYNLPAYGHQIITLTSPSLPGTLLVNCDGSVNVATIRLSQ
jgi:hypothetical protein